MCRPPTLKWLVWMAVTPTLAMRVQKNPVARVTDLLERLQDKVEKQGKDEAKLWETMQCNCKKTSTNLQKNVEQEEARRSNEPTSTSSYSRDLLPGCHCSAATMQPWAHKRLGSMRRRSVLLLKAKMRKQPYLQRKSSGKKKPKSTRSSRKRCKAIWKPLAEPFLPSRKALQEVSCRRMRQKSYARWCPPRISGFRIATPWRRC
eukprot:symbB.v1.2.004257.t1/scaffold241.1/size254724/12